jgi:hypothetical protein
VKFPPFLKRLLCADRVLFIGEFFALGLKTCGPLWILHIICQQDFAARMSIGDRVRLWLVAEITNSSLRVPSFAQDRLSTFRALCGKDSGIFALFASWARWSWLRLGNGCNGVKMANAVKEA